MAIITRNSFIGISQKSAHLDEACQWCWDSKLAQNAWLSWCLVTHENCIHENCFHENLSSQLKFIVLVQSFLRHPEEWNGCLNHTLIDRSSYDWSPYILYVYERAISVPGTSALKPTASFVFTQLLESRKHSMGLHN